MPGTLGPSLRHAQVDPTLGLLCFSQRWQVLPLKGQQWPSCSSSQYLPYPLLLPSSNPSAPPRFHH